MVPENLMAIKWMGHRTHPTMIGMNLGALSFAIGFAVINFFGAQWVSFSS